MNRKLSQTTLLLVCVLGAGLLVTGAGLVAAGDSIAIYEFSEDDGYEATAGDTVDVDLYMQSDGGYSGEGLQSSEATVAVNESVASITAVDHGPWIRADNDSIDIEQTATVDDATATVRHNRTPPGDGAVGKDRFATLTVELDEDVPSADVVVAVIDAEALLVNGFPIRTEELETVISVDGGGDRFEPAVAGAADDGGGDDAVAVTTVPDAHQGDESSTDDGGPPVLLAAVAGGLGAAMIVAGVVTWLRRP